MQRPRSLDFWILRTCERLGITPDDFTQLEYSQQMSFLAFNRVRILEESLELNSTGASYG